MSDAELQKLPIKRFWLYSRNIDRIRSEEDMRTIKVLIAKTSAEAFTDTTEGLRKQLGEVIEFEKITKEAILNVKTDPSAINMLRMLAGQKKGDRVAK